MTEVRDHVADYRDPAEEPAVTVEQRAFEIFEQRGGEHGHDVEDWLEAEKQIKGSAAGQ